VPPNEQLTLVSNTPLPVGAAVTVTLPDRYLLLGAGLVYGVPLAALLTGAGVAAALFDSDLAAAAGAGVALLAALLGTSFLRRRLEHATLRRLDVRLAAPR
jgi:positive regulator of sigma E activity